MRNEIQIDKKGVKLKCLPCSSKISRRSKTKSTSSKRDMAEEILSSTEEPSMAEEVLTSTEERSFAMAFNRDITNESNREHCRAITD